MLRPHQRLLLAYTLLACTTAAILCWLWPAQRTGILAMLAAGLLAAWLLARVSTWLIRRRIREIRKAADAITSLDTLPKDDFSKLRISLSHLTNQLRTTLQEQDRLRERLTRSEKLALIGELAAIVAHEINNPLDGLQNCTRIIRRKSTDTEELNQLFDLMESGLYRIEMTVRRLLCLSREEPAQLVPTRVDEMIEEAITFVQPRLDRNSIEVVRDFPGSPIEALADRWQFVQALINLFINAADAMPHSGQLALTCRTDSAAHVIIEVGDNGTGIADQHRESVFEPFFTTKKRGLGTGLGLAVVSRVVEAHNGRIGMHTRVGEGTRFTITLPAAIRSPLLAKEGPGEARTS